jgi:MOSC domain-containing protein YiiM
MDETSGADGRTAVATPTFHGRVTGLWLADERGGDPSAREAVEAVAGRGLRGDRYFRPAEAEGPGVEVTLIEREALLAAERDHGVTVPGGAHRRNLVTEGVPLNHLVGRRLRVGEAVVEGTALCEPCAHMESLATDGAREALVHRGGLEGRIVASGTVRLGDRVVPADES